MLYRSLRIRAFQATGKFCLLARRWHSEDTDQIRNLATIGSLEAKGGTIDEGNPQLEKALREYEGYKSGRAIRHEVLSDQDEAQEAAKDSRPREIPIPSIQSTFLAEYGGNEDTHTQPPPDGPEDLEPPANQGEISDLQRRMLLRRESLEAAPFRIRRRSQLMSQVIESERRLKDMAQLLYFVRRSQDWTTNFRILFYSHSASGREENWQGKLRIATKVDKWFKGLYRDGNISEITDRWSRHSRKQKRRRWPHILLRCLLTSAEQALNFILATHVEPFPPVEMVMDALLYLKRERGEEIRASAELRSRFGLAMWRQQQPTRWFYVIERNHLDLLLEDSSIEEGKELFEKLNAIDTDLSYHCRLSFMDFFTRAGEVDFAIKALVGINPEMRHKSEDQLLRRCTDLLELDSVIDDGVSPNFRILPTVLEAGVKPDLILHNVVMNNAVKFGVSAVAWDLLRYMEDNNLSTDARTYLALMRDALARRDAVALDEVLTAMHTRDDLYTNAHLVVQTLSVIQVIHGRNSKLNPRMVFFKMLAVYTRVFSTAPLKHLKMVGEATQSSSNQNQVEPDVRTLAFVVLSYVLVQRSPMVVQSLWEWVEYLRSEGDDLALGLTGCSIFYDGFISFFSRQKATLPVCLRILRLMLDRKLQPSATTWGILATAFTKHGYFQAAEELRMPVDYLEVFRRKTTRSIMTNNLDIDLAESVRAALRHLEEVSEHVSFRDGSASADEGQMFHFEEQRSGNAVDDILHSDASAARNVPEGHQLSPITTSNPRESSMTPRFENDRLIEESSPDQYGSDVGSDETVVDILSVNDFVDQNVSEEKSKSSEEKDGYQTDLSLEGATLRDTEREPNMPEIQGLEYSGTEMGPDNYLWRRYTKTYAEAAEQMGAGDESAELVSRKADEAWIRIHSHHTTKSHGDAVGPPKPAGDVGKV